MNILLPIIVHAHEAATPHVEEPAQINPVVAIGVLLIVALGGFLLWKFVLNTRAPSPQNKVEPPPQVPNPTSTATSQQHTETKPE